MELDGMTVLCQRCGAIFPGTETSGPCPKCGYTGIRIIIDTSQNYSGTVAVSGSNASAFEAINYAKNMLASISSFDPNRADFVKPIIKQLDTASKLVQEQESQLAIARKSDWMEYESKIEDYIKLLEKNAEESEFQTFFENVPVFLEPKVMKAYPKFSLAGELIPDFLLVLHDSSYLFVEIEKPGVKLFTNNGDPTAVLSHAQQQIRDYLKWVANNIDFLRRHECPNLTGDNFKGLLVIGKCSDLEPKELDKLHNINAEVRSKYEIKAFDQILRENKTMVGNVKKYYQ